MPGVATTLKITSTPVSGVASATATLGQITVTEYDQFGNLSTTFENVGLSSNSSGTVRVRHICRAGRPSFRSRSRADRRSSATFYYGDTMAGTPTITASASGLTSGTQQETIVAGAAEVAEDHVAAGLGPRCDDRHAGADHRGRSRPFGNVSTTAETVGLASSSTGTTEFATSLSGMAVTSVSIPSGSSTASFYYGDTQAGTPTITASASGLNSGTQQETIIADAAKSLKFTSSPVSGPAAASATLGQITVTEYDQFGNLSTTAETVSLTRQVPGRSSSPHLRTEQPSVQSRFRADRRLPASTTAIPKPARPPSRPRRADSPAPPNKRRCRDHRFPPSRRPLPPLKRG